MSEREVNIFVSFTIFTCPHILQHIFENSVRFVLPWFNSLSLNLKPLRNVCFTQLRKTIPNLFAGTVMYDHQVLPFFLTVYKLPRFSLEKSDAFHTGVLIENFEKTQYFHHNNWNWIKNLLSLAPNADSNIFNLICWEWLGGVFFPSSLDFKSVSLSVFS